ncbi:transglutaminase-like cysteine peptidase [Pelagibius sp.]|uniref:transglutaminase-like cysteine peptidase n=1 Tax=Pelagibius sp. TaxID=1931238 RepID=UPI003BAF412E
MRFTRRQVLSLPAAVLAASAVVPFTARPAVAPPGRHRHPSISPFHHSTRHHHTFLALQRSEPKIEARLQQWMEILQRETPTLHTSDHPVLVRWRRELSGLPQTHDERLVAAVNRMVNSDVRYLSDWRHGGGRDRWYGPLETLQEGGDCEDYALLKGYVLYTRGWPLQNLHLVAGILLSGEAHMMLGVDYGPGRQVLLDNLVPHIHDRPFGGWMPRYQIGPHQKTLVYIKTF